MSRLKEIEERCEKATPEPWRGDRYDGTVKYAVNGANDALVLKVDHKNCEYGFIGDNGEHDEPFVLHARSDIPYLLSELRAALARAERAEALVRELRPYIAKYSIVGRVDALLARIAELEKP